MNGKVKYCSHLSDDGDPLGFFIAPRCVGFISKGSRNSPLAYYLLASESAYQALIISETETGTCQISKYTRGGNFEKFYYTHRMIHDQEMIPFVEQAEICEQITAKYRQGGRANEVIVVFVHGDPGVGKSSIPIILTQQLGGSLCTSYRPTDPGDDLETLYFRASPTRTKPLIVVLEEVDVTIASVIAGILDHPKYPIPVRNKSQWNTMFDNLSNEYRNLIVIATSNVRPEEIPDQSMIREGRFHFWFEITGRTVAPVAEVIPE